MNVIRRDVQEILKPIALVMLSIAAAILFAYWTRSGASRPCSPGGTLSDCSDPDNFRWERALWIGAVVGVVLAAIRAGALWLQRYFSTD